MPELRPPYAAIRVAKVLEVGLDVDLDAGATKSLRFREVNEKEAFTLRDAAGAYFRASVVALGAERARVSVYEALPISPEAPVRITLACAVLARQRMITVAQKATELGVTRIVPIFSVHSVPPAGLAHEKAHAWPGQLLRAARQCRRATVPELAKPVTLERFVDDALWRDADRRFMLDDRTTSPAEALSTTGSQAATDVVFAVGPEGGWSDSERALLAAKGASPLRLGGRVLRAETAVFAGLTVLQYVYGDLAPGCGAR